MLQKRINLQRKIASILLVLGIGISVFYSLHVKQGIEQEFARDLAFAADEVTARIEERLAAYALALRGAAALFAASGDINRTQWRSYYEILQLSDTITGVQGIGYAVLIPSDQVSSHTAGVRAEGFPDYQVYPALLVNTAG